MSIMRPLCLTIAGILTLSGTARSQAPTAAQMDRLLGRLVGRWTMKGAVRGTPATYTLDATRVLQGRFVQLHMTDVAKPPGYEALVSIGVDSAAGRYLAHWLDNTGAAYSVPPATGTARGDTLFLNFAYPDGPFRDTFSYDRATDAWHFLLEAGDSAGRWTLFADYVVRRRR